LDKNRKFQNSQLFYRGIRFYDHQSAGDDSLSLGKLLEIPGYCCDINILSDNAENIIEINRDRVKTTALPILRKHFANALDCFFDVIIDYMHQSDNVIIAMTKPFQQLLTLYCLTSGKDINKLTHHPNIEKYIDCAHICSLPEKRLDPLENKGWDIYTIQCPLKELLSLYNRNLWFIDFDESINSNFITRNYSEDYPDLKIILDNNVMAILNHFPMLQNIQYRRLIAFRDKNSQSNEIIKLYQLTESVYDLPSMDEYSYFLIVQRIIFHNRDRLEQNDIDESYFPAFPACHFLSKSSDFLKNLTIDAIPLGADYVEADRFNKWVLSPLPIGVLYSKTKNKFFWQYEKSGEDTFDEAKQNKNYVDAYETLEYFICKNRQPIETEKIFSDELRDFASFLYNIFLKYSNNAHNKGNK